MNARLEIREEYRRLRREPGMTRETVKNVWSAETGERETFFTLRGYGLLKEVPYKSFLVLYELMEQTVSLTPVLYAYDILSRGGIKIDTSDEYRKYSPISVNQRYLCYIIFEWLKKVDHINPLNSPSSHIRKFALTKLEEFEEIEIFELETTGLWYRLEDTITIEVNRLIRSKSIPHHRVKNFGREMNSFLFFSKQTGLWNVAKTEGCTEGPVGELANHFNFFTSERPKGISVFREKICYDCWDAYIHYKTRGELETLEAKKAILFKALVGFQSRTLAKNVVLYEQVQTQLNALRQAKIASTEKHLLEFFDYMIKVNTEIGIELSCHISKSS